MEALCLHYRSADLIAAVAAVALCIDCGQNRARYFESEFKRAHGHGIPERCGLCDMTNNGGAGFRAAESYE